MHLVFVVTEISRLVGSKGLIKVFILALIVRRGKNGPNTLKSECWLGTAASKKGSLNRNLVFCLSSQVNAFAAISS